MPITDQNKAALSAAFDALPVEVQQIFNNESTENLLAAMGDIIGSRRSTGMQGAIASALSGGTVTNWAVLDAARAVADSATIVDSLRTIEAAMDAHNDTGLFVKMMAFTIAAMAHFKKA